MISFPIVPAFLSNCGRSQVQKTGCPAHSEFPWRVSWGPACESGSEQNLREGLVTLATHLGCLWEEKLLLKSLSLGLCYRHQGNFPRRLGGLSRRVCSAPRAGVVPLPPSQLLYGLRLGNAEVQAAGG